MRGASGDRSGCTLADTVQCADAGSARLSSLTLGTANVILRILDVFQMYFSFFCIHVCLCAAVYGVIKNNNKPREYRRLTQLQAPTTAVKAVRKKILQ